MDFALSLLRPRWFRGGACELEIAKSLSLSYELDVWLCRLDITNQPSNYNMNLIFEPRAYQRKILIRNPPRLFLEDLDFLTTSLSEVRRLS